FWAACRLRQRHELTEERARRLGVEPVDDVRRLAGVVAGEGSPADDVVLAAAGADEVGAARVAVAGAAVAGVDVLRQPQPGGGARGEAASRALARSEVSAHRAHA